MIYHKGWFRPPFSATGCPTEGSIPCKPNDALSARKPCGFLFWSAAAAAIVHGRGVFRAGAWPTPGGKPEKKVEKKTDKDDEKIPKPEDLVLRTGDGLELALTYYPGTKGKQTIPIVLLHMWKQSRNEYKDLAPALQALGYAVIVPDLRGHGESTRMKGARRDETLNAAKMPPAQFGLMVTEDMKAVKDFLWERNNAGELNIDKLCVVGAEMGASVALNFARPTPWSRTATRCSAPTTNSAASSKRWC